MISNQLPDLVISEITTSFAKLSGFVIEMYIKCQLSEIWVHLLFAHVLTT